MKLFPSICTIHFVFTAAAWCRWPCRGIGPQHLQRPHGLAAEAGEQSLGEGKPRRKGVSDHQW